MTGGFYRPHDLRAGHQLLVRASLVMDIEPATPTNALMQMRSLPDDVVAELLLQELLAREPPLWLYAAVVEDEVRWEAVPVADQDALRQLLHDASRREALLLNLGRTVDSAMLAEYGDLGEQHVVQACQRYLRDEQQRPDLAAQVSQVSRQSDQLGYDVTSPDTTGRRHRIEVKTTGSAAGDRVEFFISRNEATVGERDPCWSLVAVRRDADQSLEIVGWCRGLTLLPLLPRDLSPQGRWTSVRLSVPKTEFIPGLPLDVSG
ncbi:hypothetical protein GCM10009616_34460 [Microlunatus lacustris]